VQESVYFVLAQFVTEWIPPGGHSRGFQVGNIFILTILPGFFITLLFLHFLACCNYLNEYMLLGHCTSDLRHLAWIVYIRALIRLDKKIVFYMY